MTRRNWLLSLDSLIRWPTLRSLFIAPVTNSLLTYFFIVPLAASVFSGLQRPVEFLGQDISFEIPFNWAVLYVGSLCYASAFSLYLGLAPEFTKRYRNYSEFQKALGGRPPLTAYLSRFWSASVRVRHKDILHNELISSGMARPLEKIELDYLYSRESGVMINTLLHFYSGDSHKRFMILVPSETCMYPQGIYVINFDEVSKDPSWEQRLFDFLSSGYSRTRPWIRLACAIFLLISYSTVAYALFSAILRTFKTIFA